MTSALRARLKVGDPPTPTLWECAVPGPPEPGWVDLWLAEVGDGGARLWLRRLLAAALGCPPEDVAIATGCAGKPELRAPGTPPFNFNFSRSGALALAAIRREGPVGIDLEQAPLAAGISWPAIARQRFAAADCRALQALPPERAADAFLRLWTRHEAILKAAGTGLAARLATGLGPGRASGEARHAGALWLWRDLNLPAGHRAHAALALGTAAAAGGV